jgi:hypothetical protein
MHFLQFGNDHSANPQRREVEEIEYLSKTYGVREVQFYDDTFTVMKKNVMRFCELMAAKDLNVSWAAVRADASARRWRMR